MIVRSRRVILPDGERPAAIVIDDGRITAIESYQLPVSDDDTDIGDLMLLPGLVDPHVHVNEPGRTEWEGFETATRAAAAGGVTTILDMPLNSIPPTVDVTALRIKQAVAAGRVHVDVGFWGGAVPHNAGDLIPLADAGVFGFKAFLADSGVPEFPPLDRRGLVRAFARLDALFALHAEDPDHLAETTASAGYAGFLASRPPQAEVSAIRMAVEAARAADARIHILHVSAADGLQVLRLARAAGVRVTAETCPHYLTLDVDQIPPGGTEFKCCPPIRDAGNRDGLWQGLMDGTIDIVASDHSPCTSDLKRRESGDFASAWGGIASLQLGLPVVWTEALRRGVGLDRVVRWMASGPADVTGLPTKGRIAPGADADLVAFDPYGTFIVDHTVLYHRNPITPYAGRRLSGVVHCTWLRGVPVGGRPRGRLLVMGGTRSRS